MDSFSQRKKAVLEKIDKSSKGSWDNRIISFCKGINNLDDYYTTSSCSGKAVIMEEKTGKDGAYYNWESHELISLDELKEEISKLPPFGLFKFKSESPIVFVACRDISSARELYSFSVSSGFKESGIKITNKLIGVEIRSGEKLEFPLLLDGNILVGDDFLDETVYLSNFKRKRGWEKIVLLEEFIK